MDIVVAINLSRRHAMNNLNEESTPMNTPEGEDRSLRVDVN